LGQGLVLLMVKSSPGVNPNLRFGPILDSPVTLAESESLPRAEQSNAIWAERTWIIDSYYQS